MRILSLLAMLAVAAVATPAVPDAAAVQTGAATTQAQPAAAQVEPAERTFGATPIGAQQPRTLRSYWHLFAAFAFTWVLLFGYVLSIGRRWGKLEDEVRALKARGAA